MKMYLHNIVQINNDNKILRNILKIIYNLKLIDYFNY